MQLPQPGPTAHKSACSCRSQAPLRTKVHAAAAPDPTAYMPLHAGGCASVTTVYPHHTQLSTIDASIPLRHSPVAALARPLL